MIKKIESAGSDIQKEEKEEAPEPSADDPRYFKLSKPIAVNGKTISVLLVDSSELSGTVYFTLMGRFRREFPAEYRSSINKLTDEQFLSYVIAELNPPMIMEDVRKITFSDLSILFLQTVSFLFGARAETETKE